MAISSKSNGIAAAASAATATAAATTTTTTTTTIGGTKRKSKVPVSTSFSGLSKPRKPRGPRTPYNFFFADERAKMGEAESQQDAAATMAAIKQGGGTGTGTSKPKPTFETTKTRNREIAKKWRHFAQMQKLLGDNDLMKSYRAMAAEDEVRYQNEMAEYLDDVEAYNEAEAEEEFIQLKKRVIAEAHAKHGKSKKKKARVEENNGSSTNTNNNDDDEARVQPSLSGSPTNNNAGTSSNNTNKDTQEPTIRGEEEGGEAAAAAAMTNMASGLGLVGRTPLQNRIHPGPPRAAAHHPGVAAASPYYMHHGSAAPPPPPPQYHHPNMSYYYPGGMYTMPHMAHPPTLNALMAQRAGEAAAVHMPPSLPAQAVDDRISASMAYLQGYAAACSAMIDRQVAVPAAAAAHPTPAQDHQQPSSASAPTRSDLEKAVAVAGPVPTAAKVAAPSSTDEDAALLEESPLTLKKVDKDIFVARRRQGQKTNEE